MRELNFNNLDEYKKWFNESNPFLKYTGGELTVVREEYAEVELTTDERHGNINGTVHGGVLFTLADTAIGAASKSRGRHSATIEGKMNFVRPVPVGSYVKAVASAIHAGNKTGVYECKLLDDQDRLLAFTVCTMFMLDKPLSDRVSS